MPPLRKNADGWDATYKEFWSAIEACAETHGLTFAELSELSGVDQGVLSRARRGHFYPTTENLLRLLLTLFGDETRCYAKQIKAAAKRRPA
jgi:transcriptional regulator with XRE-family HTH domain